jgi:hypothetical protein
LEWYNIVDVPELLNSNRKVPRDPETGMAVAVRSGQFNIVSIDAIVRAVHMQPLFEDCNSAQKAMAYKLDVYSFDSYLVNKFADRISWEDLY